MKYISDILCIICFVIICNISYSQTLHAIIFASTVDYRIGEANTIIFNRLVEEVNRIGEYTNMNINLHAYKDENFNLSKAKSVIDNLYCDSNSVILFFFLGHGYRWDETSTKWPYLAFSNKTYISDKEKDIVSWREDEIYNKLLRKGARFVGVFAEACNNSVGTVSYVSNSNKNINRSLSNVLDTKKYKSLFLQIKGSIILSSSKANQVSYVNTSEGGLFMSNFLEILHQNTALNDNILYSDWFTILNKSKYATIDLAKKDNLVQIPQYEMNITYTNNLMQYGIAENLLKKGNNCTETILNNYSRLKNLISELPYGISMREMKKDCFYFEKSGLELLYNLRKKNYDTYKVNNCLINFYKKKSSSQEIKNEIKKLSEELY